MFISVVLPYSDRWYFSEVLNGATARAAESGYDVAVRVIPPVESSTAQAVAAIGADFAGEDCAGAVVTGFKYRADQKDRALGFHRPVVVIGGSVLGFPTVMIDDIAAGTTATEHLLKLGHRRITHLTGPLDHQIGFSVDGRRAKGYRTALDQAGLPATVIETDFDPEGARRQARRILEQPQPPTAIFASSDELAFSVLAVMSDLGLEAGTDVSVIGIDDHPAAAAAQLTTIRQRPAELGSTAIDLLLADLDHDADPARSRLQPVALITRASTRPAGTASRGSRSQVRGWS